MKGVNMKKIVAIIFYLISLCSMSFYLIFDNMPSYNLTTSGRLILLGGTCIFLYLAGYLLSKYLKDNKPMKINLWIFFILYLILFLTLTLFDPMWNRSGINFNYDVDTFNYYINNCINLIPFATIIEYVKAFNSLLPPGTVIANLLGNFICLMPLGLFLPLLFKSQNNWKKFLLTVFIFVLGIELVQLLTLTGHFDIDDIILNVSGACAMYFLIKNKEMNKLIRNIFLLEDNKNNMKILTKILIILLSLVAVVISLIMVYRKSFDDRLNRHLSNYNYEITIIDENEKCTGELEKFYEDNLYNYYFSCTKSDKVYAQINGQEKYLVKDLLNENQTQYYISIDKLEESGLKFIKEDKYVHIDYSIKNSKYKKNRLKEIDNDDILEIISGADYIDGDKFSSSIYIVPKKEGTAEIEIEFMNDIDEVIETKKYSITIDENLKVKYDEIK